MQDEEPAREELKRIDHLIFVTLKYTRTVDIIRTIIGKFILTLDHQTEKYYSMQLEKGKIKEIPRVPLMRMKKLEQIHIKDTKIKDMVDFYVQLKAIYNADFKAKEEYRKNVTLVTKGKEIKGVIVTRTKKYKLDISLRNIEAMLEKPVIGVIPEDPSIREALSLKESIIYTHPRSNAAQGYLRLAAAISGAQGPEDIKLSWIDKFFKVFKRVPQ